MFFEDGDDANTGAAAPMGDDAAAGTTEAAPQEGGEAQV
jgi:hypothetical protein